MRLYLKSSDDFLLFLQQNGGNVVCGVLKSLHTQGVDSKYLSNNYANFLSPAEDNKAKIAFLPINRYGLCNNWDASKRMMIKPGKLLGKIATPTLMSYFNITPKDLEAFSNLYTSRFVGGEITVVNGMDILHYYHEDSYGAHGGSLWDSCMRYDTCNSFMRIYAKNPDVCSMAIMKDHNRNIDGRALLWTTTDGKKIMDRIYFNREYHVDTFIAWAKARGIAYKRKQSYSCNDWYVKSKDGLYEMIRQYKITVQLKDIEYDEYPYMDSIYYYNRDKHTISNIGIHSHPEVSLRDTGGGYEDENSHECMVSGDMISEEDARYCIHHDGYIHMDYAVRLERRQEYIWEERAKHSEYHDEYISTHDAYYSPYDCDYYYEEDVIALKNGKNCFNEQAIEIDGEYYHRDEECVETYDGTVRVEEECELLSDGRYAHQDDEKLIFCEEDGTYYLTN